MDNKVECWYCGESVSKSDAIIINKYQELNGISLMGIHCPPMNGEARQLILQHPQTFGLNPEDPEDRKVYEKLEEK